MSEVDRLAEVADIPPALARMVVEAAARAGVSVRSFRDEDRRPRLVRERQRVAVWARDHEYGWWQIARALNRDHKTVIHAERRGRRLDLLERIEAADQAPSMQLTFLHGPLFDLGGELAYG